MQITLHPLPGVVLLAIKVHRNAYDFGVYHFDEGDLFSFNTSKDGSESHDLPPGTWECIGTTDAITEEQYQQFLPVEEHHETFTTYRIGDITCFSGKAAIRNLIIAAGGDEKTRYAILKKIIQ